MDKLFGILVLISGEVITIGAEIYGAKYFGLEFGNFKTVFWKLVLPMTFGGFLLLTGYMLSMQSFKNIWVVTVISISSIIIAEPILNYAITHQSPTRGALIGFILGALGLLATLFL
jgi:hypothetical protein